MIFLMRFIQIFFPVLLIAIPHFLYKKRYKFMIRFYRSMVDSPAIRKGYITALSVTTLLFSYTFFKTDGASLWLLPSLLYSLLLLCYSFTDATLSWLHDDLVLLGLTLALLMFCLILPELYTLCVSLGTTMLAAMFYPSRRIRRMAKVPEPFSRFHGTEAEIMDNYY